MHLGHFIPYPSRWLKSVQTASTYTSSDIRGPNLYVIMRLLEIKNSGPFSLTKDLLDDIPPYAILSHTWGKEDEEVSLNDLVTGAGSNKIGYRKLDFCREQARSDNLHHFWVDTCCIDKANHAELSEAINSMFRWYREAAKCYAYLGDVSTHSFDENDHTGLTWESAFRKSRWFTRGWTLQELIAPVSVEFFSREGKLLGNKRSLEQQVHEITGVPISALQGRPLSDFSVSERISWAESRETKRKEDKAYSLMGIFDIHMPLIYGEGREEAFIRLRDEIDKRLRNFQREEVLSVPRATFKPSWIVPLERNPRFTGREFELAQLEGMLFVEDRTTKIAITGLGGVGKTHLLLELIYQMREKHKNCSVIWLPATNMENLENAYREVAQYLGIPGSEEDKADVKRLVQGYLSKENVGQWLLVFDNADNINMWINTPGLERESGRLIEYLPKSKEGSILFTTRDRKIAYKLVQRKQNIIEVPEMNKDVATQLLQKYLPDQDFVKHEQDAKALLEGLTYLPLAIIQAAAYINENGIAISEYLSLLKGQEEEVIDLLSEDFEDDGRYHNIKNPVATTWLISFEAIRYRDPLAAEFLSFMACVDPKGVPQSLLPPGPSRKKETDAIGTLDAYSFIIRRPADLALNLHRLVHLATRNWLRKEGLITQWTEKAISRLEEVFPGDSHKNRSLWRTYLPHARYALLFDLVDKNREIRINLMWRFGMCLYSDGRYNDAEVPLIEVVERRKRVLGAEHPEALTSINNLAATYLYQGRWKEATELGEELVETRKRVQGGEHPDTLQSMNNLASAYGIQGRWNEAEELFIYVVETQKSVLGEKHRETLQSMNNLAWTFENQGRWKEAEGLGEEVMKTRKRVLGEEHRDTLSSMNNLAVVFWHQGRWKDAEELGRKVMETQKRVLGVEHPEMLTSINNLAMIFLNQGQLEEAEELGEEVIEIRKRVLGEEHPDTLTSIANLAFIHLCQDRLEEAEKLGKEVIENQKRILGGEHPDTLQSKNNLAETFSSQGRLEEARELGTEVMVTRKRVLGEEHPATLRSMVNLAFMWKNLKRDAEAVKLMEECVQLRTRILGSDHPCTVLASAALMAWQAEKFGVSASDIKRYREGV